MALAIMGLALVAIFQIFSITMRSTKKADDYTRALFYARSVLDQAYVLPDVEAGYDLTDFRDGFEAKRDISLKSSSNDDKAKLYEITVTVTWPPSGSLTIKGLRNVYETES